MAYFPFFIDIAGKHCLLVGGGIVALRKAEVLVPFGVNIKVVSPVICDELVGLKNNHPDQITLKLCEYQDEDLSGADFVIAASSEEELNHQIAKICHSKNILVNVVDVKEDCSFIVPAILHKDSYTIAVSSGGRSPAAASHLKCRVEEAIPRHYSRLVSQMGEYRDYVKMQIDNQPVRAEVFQKLLEAGLDHDCNLSDALVDQILKEYIGG